MVGVLGTISSVTSVIYTLWDKETNLYSFEKRKITL